VEHLFHENFGPNSIYFAMCVTRVASLLLEVWACYVGLLGTDETQTFESTVRSPSRIIAIAPNAAEIVCALQACDRIVGVDRFSLFPPELSTRARVGGLFDPDLEKMIALRPDLVILRGRSEAVQSFCRKWNIALYQDPTERLADIRTCITDLAVRLDRRAEGERLIAHFDQRLADVRRRSRGRERPRVFVAVSRATDQIANVLTTGKGTFLDEMVEIAGGINVFGHLDMSWPQVSPEGILAAKPEVILELAPELELTDEIRKRMIDQWSAIGPMPATTAGRVCFLVQENALRPSPRFVEIIEKVSMLLHPDHAISPP